MTRSRPPFLAAAAAVPLATLALAACGGGSHSASTAAGAPAKSETGHPATVRVANSRLGNILVDSQARTLYLFQADAHAKSACSGACATAWPPLRASTKPVAGSGVTAATLATTARTDGKSQVTYNGHPLYTFVKDNKAGDTNGEGLTAFGARWFAVTPAGNQVQGAAPSSGAAPARTTTPAAPPSQPAPRTTPAPPPPAPKSSPAPKQSPPASNGIPQNNGGDQDSDNNGGPSDGDGGI
jgi:predicted lipoprotein with Yx(FWY)xxD motif